MKFKLLSMIALSVFIVTSAVAGGGINIQGTWVGKGQAMYVDGTTATIGIDPVSISQTDDGFVYGTVSLTYEIGGVTTSQTGQVSGHIQGNVLKGILGFCQTVAPDCVGLSILDGKITGNSMSGTVTDLSDGSVSAITLKRMAQ
jgi:hypothetical protein